MKLVLAEKPSVAQSYARVLGTNKRCDGYLEGNDRYQEYFDYFSDQLSIDLLKKAQETAKPDPDTDYVDDDEDYGYDLEFEDDDADSSVDEDDNEPV